MKKPAFAIIVAAMIASVSLSAQTPYTKTFSVDDAIPNGTGWSYWFIPTGSVADTLNVKMSCVNTGTASHTPHTHPHHELFILLEGEAVLHINGEDHEFHPGDGFMCPGGSAHSLRRVNEDQPIRYLMFNTEAHGIRTPFPFWKEDYKAADCYTPSSKKKSFWYVTPEQTLGGLNVRSVGIKGRKEQKYDADGRQLIFVIMEGTADITVDGTPVHLPAMSVCYVPKGSSSTIKSADGKLRYLAVHTH